MEDKNNNKLSKEVKYYFIALFLAILGILLIIVNIISWII